MLEIPKEVIEFNKLVRESEKVYKGKLSDIGNYIYNNIENQSNEELLRVAKNCNTKIKRGIPIT